MARLNHPNLIGVYDFGEVNGMLYIIMEYVPGKSLYHSAYGKSIAPKEVIRLVTGICKGLAHAHENGILHRDIKPSNILLDHNAEPKIGDFGLARPIGTKVEEGEEIFGTPHYTAPEVVSSPHSVDYRADIFSVGVLLHELLTGHLPAADSRPASMIAKCDVRFDAIIRKATQPLAAARYSSANEIAKELQAIAGAGGPKGPGAAAAPSNNKGRSRKPAVPVPRSAKSFRSSSGRPTVVTTQRSANPAVVVFLLALLIAAAAAYVFYMKNPPVEPEKSKVIVLPVTPKSEKKDKSADEGNGSSESDGDSPSGSLD
jgi:serine/threonine protein kinase